MEKCQLVVIPHTLPPSNLQSSARDPHTLGMMRIVGETISVVPTPSVFIYQLWSKFHRVFNKSHGFKNGFAHGTHRSFEIEKDYKERLQKVYRHSPAVSIVAFDDFDSLCHHGEILPTFKPVGIGFPPKELYAGAASRLDHALEGDHHS